MYLNTIMELLTPLRELTIDSIALYVQVWHSSVFSVAATAPFARELIVSHDDERDIRVDVGR